MRPHSRGPATVNARTPAVHTLPQRTFATGDVARLLAITPSRVRAMVRAGLSRPSRLRRRYQFSFQDVVLLRTAHGLLCTKVPPRRVRRALNQLSRQLPPGRPLSGVRIYADGRDVVVRDGRATWKPESGQLLLSFKLDDLAKAARSVVAVEPRRKPVSPLADEDGEPQDAMDWFELALDREQDGDIDGARAAYLKAVEHDPSLSDAFVNLGRLAHEGGDAVEAARLYHQAIESDPEDPIAHYNLAIALEDQENLPAAVQHYEAAIRIDKAFADAHFNLSRILDRLGKRVQALRHLMLYKKLTRRRS